MFSFFLKIKKILILLTNKVWLKGLINGVAANIELKNLLSEINPKSIIDIGSNKGQFILLTKGLFKNLFFYSFEPQKSQIKIQKKIFEKLNNIKYFNFALGKKKSIKKFYITNRNDSSSFFKISNNLKKNKDYKIIKEEKIIIKRVSKVLNLRKIKKPIIVKIDVQGYEKNVLEGFGKSIKYIDFFIIEVSNSEMYKNQPKSKEIINFLLKKNFKIKKKNEWNKIQTSKKVKQTDILFKNLI